jgi:hypothetical protein
MSETMEGLAYELTSAERKDVRDRYPKTYFPSPVLEPVWAGRRELRRIPDKFAIVDQCRPGPLDASNQVFGICSDQYKIVPFEDVVHMVENSVGKLTEYGKVQICPHTYLDGARLNIGIKFPEMKHEIRKLDSIIPKVEVFSSYDLSTKLMGRFGAFQLKCLNGAGIWKSFKSFAKRHLQNLFLNELGNNISEGMALFGEQVDSWKKWTELKLDQKLYDTVWDELPFSAAERIKIEALPEIGTNLQLGQAIKGNSLDLWSLSSVLTQFATHGVKSELRRIELEPAIARVMDLTFDRAAVAGLVH